LFVSLLGASNSGGYPALSEKAIPGESFGAGKGLSGTSTGEGLEVVEEPITKIIPKLKERVGPDASGADPNGDKSLSKMRAVGDIVDSLTLPNTQNNGCEWNGRYIYIVEAQSGDSSVIRVLDPEDGGSLVEEWKLPFIGAVMGMGFVNNSMYVSCWTDGTIKKVNPTTHALITSFAAPGGTAVRGMTSDAEDLYVGAASTVDTLYMIDTLGTVLQIWYIGDICDWVMDIAIDTRGSAMWLVDGDADRIIHADSSGTVIDTFPAPGNPGGNYAEGIAFDGSDIWYNTYYGDQLYRIDGGYARSRIALFQDHEPWGRRSIKEILYDNGIPFKVFDSTDIGNADLSKYTKAIIPGQQDSLLGVAIANNRTWWENWINSGGVLQISGATYWEDNWEGLILPGGFSCISSDTTTFDTVDLVSPWHPLVNEPYFIDDDSLDQWNYSTHGYLIGISDHYTVVEDTFSRPVLAIKRMGDGGIIATMQSLTNAWYLGYSTMLENVVKYWQYGVSTNVLFAISDVDQPWMRNALMERDSLIGNVDYMDGASNVAKVADLSMYDVVVAYPNYAFANEIAMGDTLAAFVDLGNRSVITGGWSWYSDGNDLQGAIMDTSYNPFYSPTGLNHFLVSSLGWYDAGHPMMNGISTFSEPYRDYLAVSPGADTVAKYADGEYLLGYKIAPSGGVVVGYNTVPADTLYCWSGQGVRLLANIINWSFSAGIEDVQIGDGISILEISSPIMTGNEWINLSIDSPGNVELRIINIAGMIASSKTLNYTTPGIKTVEFDVSELPSGPYFLSVKTGGGSVVKKALVIR
jgi:hypothetical protein